MRCSISDAVYAGAEHALDREQREPVLARRRTQLLFGEALRAEALEQALARRPTITVQPVQQSGCVVVHPSASSRKAARFASIADPAGAPSNAPTTRHCVRRSSLMLSILMPVYNERERVERAIADVLDTTLPTDFELIVVDDGSTDGTREILVAGSALGRARPAVRARDQPG